MQTEPFPQEQPVQKEPEEAFQDNGKKVFDFLTKTKFLDTRKSDETFETWIQNLSYEEFGLYLTRLNGMMRSMPIHARSVDGINTEVGFGNMGDEVSYLPPQADQKDGMLKDSFVALKNIKDNNDRAMLLYYIIQAVHPYSDGNGRTGRLVYSLLSDDGKNISQQGLSSLVNHDEQGFRGEGEGRRSFAKALVEPRAAYYIINREVAKKIFAADVLSQFGKIHYGATIGSGTILPEGVQVTHEEKKRIEKILDEGETACFPFRSLVVLKFLQEEEKVDEYTSTLARPVSPKEAGAQQVAEDVGKKILSIDDEKFLASLDARSVRRLIEIHKEVKGLFIEQMIDILENPHNHSIKNKEGESVLIKDTFRK